MVSKADLEAICGTVPGAVIAISWKVSECPMCC
jgi:hypothetical protein